MRFSIRDLLWLTVVVALGVVWLCDRARLSIVSNRLERAEQHIRADGWIVDWEDDDPFPIYKTPNPSAPATNLPID